jgi:hypothetical protein
MTDILDAAKTEPPAPEPVLPDTTRIPEPPVPAEPPPADMIAPSPPASAPPAPSPAPPAPAPLVSEFTGTVSGGEPPTPDVPLPPPTTVIAEEPRVPAPDLPVDSFIIPPKNTPVSVKKTVMPPPELSKKKRSPVGAILVSMLLLLIMLPVAIYFISQQQQVADTRSRAVQIDDTAGGGGIVYPLPDCNTCMPISCGTAGLDTDGSKVCRGSFSGQNCCKPKITTSNLPTAPITCAPFSSCASSALGATCKSPKNVCYECKNNTSNPNITKMWAPCGGTPSCPWPLTNGKCCPTGKDACSTPGSIVCIEDPYASKCIPWDSSCPAGHQYVYQAFDWCTEPGCYDSYLKPKYGCSTPNTPNTPNTPVTPAPQCPAIKVFRGTELITDYAKLVPGTTVTIVVGSSASKIRFSPTDTFINLTSKNAQGEWTFEKSIPAGATDFFIEVQ